ncbi:MAG: tetratricopeptide repeat protein [bacterium]|nr:tetratricopeptide repeat protein [bacterium]
MDVRILGPLEVWEGSEQLVLDSPRQRSILALLTIHANEVVSVDRIADELWGESPPESVQSTVRYHLSKLRSALGDAAVHVVTRSHGYLLEVAPEAIDVCRFEAAAGEGRGLIAAEPERAARVLVDALSMWRGEPLVDFAYESFARGEIVRLEELRLAVVEDRLDADLASGRHVDLVGELEALVGQHPLRERLWGQLMTALYRSGRQAEALRAYQHAREALAEVGIEPSEELRAVEEQVLMQDPLLSGVRRPVRRHNLPERLSSFIGRDRDIEEIRQLVGSHRLVTLTGVGGVGKTSLAVELARTLIGDYSDGVWFVVTSDVAHADLIPERLAHILGVHIQTPEGLIDQLGDYLSGRELLLVFDGCERHIDEVAGLIQSLLSAAPRLRVIATSREPLEVVGESRIEVPLLETDGVGADAVRLFEDRAGLVQPRFAVTSGNVDPVSRICRRVAGIPLAVELAAARLGALSLNQIGQHLDDQMTLLARSRRGESPHGSLRAVLDWSHELLEPIEQILFRRLAVFRGGATLEAAELVCANETLPTHAVFDLLARLVDVSLVVAYRETDRFEMLDPVRQYAAQCLKTAGEAERLRYRHAVYFRDLAQRAFDGMYGPDELEWSRTCAREEPNHTAAITWALHSGESNLATDVAAYLTRFWHGTGRVATEKRFLDPILEQARKCPSRELVILLAHAAFVEYCYANDAGAISLAGEALKVAEGLGDDFAIGHALLRMGSATGGVQGFDYTMQASEVLDRIDHPQVIDCYANLAASLLDIEDETGASIEEAEAASRKALARSQELGVRSRQAAAYHTLGGVARFRGDLEQSRTCHLNALALDTELGNQRWIAAHLATLAEMELRLGDINRAVAYHRDSMPLFGEIWGSGRALRLDGLIQIAVGQTESGIVTLLKALVAVANRSVEETADVLFALAAVCTDTGDSNTACRLYAAEQTVRSRCRLALPIPDQQQLRKHRAKLRTALGHDAYDAAWAEGGAMSIDESVAFALGALEPDQES